MRETHAFLQELKLSLEFKEVAHKAARLAGYAVETDSDSPYGEEFDRRVNLLLVKLVIELSDPAYVTRTHHRRKLYSLGCHGPLCTKANRDRDRERYRKAHSAYGTRRNKRASEFDDLILDFISHRYEAHTQSETNGKVTP